MAACKSQDVKNFGKHFATLTVSVTCLVSIVLVVMTHEFHAVTTLT